jgi:hypothetical protein
MEGGEGSVSVQKILRFELLIVIRKLLTTIFI